MINEDQIQEVLSLYNRYGWELRRVLLTPESKEKIGVYFEPIETTKAEIDALWFSRSAANGGETWELRHLSTNPFALLEVFDDEDEAEVREEAMLEVERNMREKLLNNKSGKK
jgi:hypothetical protein